MISAVTYFFANFY